MTTPSMNKPPTHIMYSTGSGSKQAINSGRGGEDTALREKTGLFVNRPQSAAERGAGISQ